MNIHLLDDAEKDLEDGYRFYEAQQKGVGSYFLDSLYSDIDSLQIYSGIHLRVHGCYRMLSHRFPYAIYYRADKHNVYVYAILDCRRSPEWNANRLGGRQR